MSQDIPFLLLRALESPFGISVVTNNPQLLRNKLYAARRETPSFACLSFIQPPVGADSRLWIIKKDSHNGEAQD